MKSAPATRSYKGLNVSPPPRGLTAACCSMDGQRANHVSTPPAGWHSPTAAASCAQSTDQAERPSHTVLHTPIRFTGCSHTVPSPILADKVAHFRTVHSFLPGQVLDLAIERGIYRSKRQHTTKRISKSSKPPTSSPPSSTIVRPKENKSSATTASNPTKHRSRQSLTPNRIIRPPESSTELNAPISNPQSYN